MVSQIRGSKKSHDTLEFLRENITAGEWAINERIPKETELMELIGVGKSTVREAVRSLANLGMLETISGVGTFVRARTPVSTILSQFLADHNIEEVLVYRRSLEIEAAQHAAINRTEEQLASIREAYALSVDPSTFNNIPGDSPTSFHYRIVEASGSKLLLDLYSGVTHVLKQASLRGQVVKSTNADTLRRDHAAILNAIEARDVRDAAHAMALHVDRDLGLGTDMLDFSPQTERVTSLIDAGYDEQS